MFDEIGGYSTRYPLFLSLCTTSSLDRTEGQTKNRPVSIARVSCLFSSYPNDVEQLYMYTKSYIY